MDIVLLEVFNMEVINIKVLEGIVLVKGIVEVIDKDGNI